MSKDSIRIKITYNSKSLTVDLQRNKPFKILREKTQSFFFPLPQYYSFFEKKTDLTPLESKNLGEIFGTRNLIILTLKESNPYIQSKLKESNTSKKNFVTNAITIMKSHIIVVNAIHLFAKRVD